MSVKSSSDFFSDEHIPTYEECIRSGSAKPSELLPHRGLASRVVDVQKARIDNLISTYIDPLLEAQAQSGLLKTTFALIPSNAKSLANDDFSSRSHVIEKRGSNYIAADASTDEVIGFSDDEYVRVVHMHGPQNNAQFWQQDAVICALEKALRTRLGIASKDVSTVFPNDEPVIVPKRSLFGRRQSHQQARNSGAKKGVGNSAEKYHVKPDEVELQIGVEEISLRTMTDMGLYETRSGEALVIRVHIGCH